SLRKKEVPAEQLLWRALRNRALGGLKFRRQHPIGPYVVDFACVLCKVAVEAEGESHLSSRRHDQKRTAFLESAGWRVLRYWNTEIFGELAAVKEAIYRKCVARSNSPPSPSPPSPPAHTGFARSQISRAGGEGTL